MNIERMAKTVASDVMYLAKRRGYGLGECGYYFEVYAWDSVLEALPDELYESAETYEMYNDEGINWPVTRELKAKMPEVYKQWREVADRAEEMACTLEDMGISTFC